MTIGSKFPLDYMITAMLLSVSISTINSILTTIILFLTIVYWLQRNYRIFKGKDEEKPK